MAEIEEVEKNNSNNEEIVENEIDVLKNQIDGLNDKLLRAIAESQNIQKRVEKEKSDISKYSVSSFAKDVLLIRDNLQLALNNCNESEEAIVAGVKLTMEGMDKTLERHGIKMIESLDKAFDPNFHQAMMEIESQDKESGIIIQVMQEGFMIHDRLLRPALVGVSKK